MPTTAGPGRGRAGTAASIKAGRPLSGLGRRPIAAPMAAQRRASTAEHELTSTPPPGSTSRLVITPSSMMAA